MPPKINLMDFPVLHILSHQAQQLPVAMSDEHDTFLPSDLRKQFSQMGNESPLDLQTQRQVPTPIYSTSQYILSITESDPLRKLS